MYTLACKDMGMASCPFVAEGETKEDVLKMMGEHGMKNHYKEMQESMGKMTKEEIGKMMTGKIKEKM